MSNPLRSIVCTCSPVFMGSSGMRAVASASAATIMAFNAEICGVTKVPKPAALKKVVPVAVLNRTSVSCSAFGNLMIRNSGSPESPSMRGSKNSTRFGCSCG